MEATLRSTDLLQADHQLVLQQLNDLDRVLGVLVRSEDVLSELRALGSFFRKEIWALIWKEEDALFPEIARHADSGSIEQMRVDHSDLRQANERFQAGVDSYLEEPGNQNAVGLLRESGQRISGLLRAHLRSEGRMLKAADPALSEAQNRHIIELFETIESDLAWGFENLEAFYP